MRFLFCGDQSVPEWFLSQLDLLSNLSFVKLRKIGGLYVVYLTDAENGNTTMTQIQDILLSSDFTENQTKTIVAMIDFILVNSTKNSVESDQLMKELIDLGIPKENCQSLCKIFELNAEKLRMMFRKNILRQNKFQEVELKNFITLKSSSNKNIGKQEYYPEYVQTKIECSNNKVPGQGNQIKFVMDKAQFGRFFEDMSGIMKVLTDQAK
jgi:hypothetical protein